MVNRWVMRSAGVLALVTGTTLWSVTAASAAPVGDAAALRMAITDLNGTGPAAEIELTPGVTYLIGSTEGCADNDNNASGDLDIQRSNPLKIFTPDGQPPAVLQMACDPATAPQRVLQTLDPDGGTAGKLTLRNLVIKSGHARADGVGHGGGVLSQGDLALEHVRFENNAAGDGEPGAADMRNGGAGGSGGAVAAVGAVTIESSVFTGNRAGKGGDGFSGTQSVPCDASAGGNGGRGGSGGAVLALQGLTITNSTFTSNRSGDAGKGGNGGCAGDLQAPGGKGGNGGVGGFGGAAQCGVLSSLPGVPATGCATQMTVRGSTFNDNAAGDGGAGGNGGTGSLGQAGGAGGDGGAGTDATGGALFFIGAPGATLTIENSTLDANTVGDGGPGGNGGQGGGSAAGGNAGNGGAAGVGGAVGAVAVTFTTTNIASLVHVTVTDNGSGGAGGNAGQPGAGGAGGTPGQPGDPGDQGGTSLAILNPWTSTATVVGDSGGGPGCVSAAASSGSSVSTDDTCFGASSMQEFGSFALGALGDNGGPTKTRLPAAGSVLLDKVSPAPLAVDQRAVTRPQGSASDIGAVEVEPVPPTTPPPTLPITGVNLSVLLTSGLVLLIGGVLLLLLANLRREQA